MSLRWRVVSAVASNRRPAKLPPVTPTGRVFALSACCLLLLAHHSLRPSARTCQIRSPFQLLTRKIRAASLSFCSHTYKVTSPPSTCAQGRLLPAFSPSHNLRLHFRRRRLLGNHLLRATPDRIQDQPVTLASARHLPIASFQVENLERRESFPL